MHGTARRYYVAIRLESPRKHVWTSVRTDASLPDIQTGSLRTQVTDVKATAKPNRGRKGRRVHTPLQFLLVVRIFNLKICMKPHHTTAVLARKNPTRARVWLGVSFIFSCKTDCCGCHKLCRPFSLLAISAL